MNSFAEHRPGGATTSSTSTVAAGHVDNGDDLADNVASAVLLLVAWALPLRCFVSRFATNVYNCNLRFEFSFANQSFLYIYMNAITAEGAIVMLTFKYSSSINMDSKIIFYCYFCVIKCELIKKSGDPSALLRHMSRRKRYIVPRI